MSEPTTSNPLTSSVEGSRVSPSAKPENDSPKMTSDGSGPSSPGSFASYDPDTRSWRTYQACLFEGLATFSETWPKQGTMRNGVCSERTTWVPPIAESESSLWPTASARDWKDTPGMALTGTNPDGSNRDRLDQLARVVYSRERHPTPRATDADKGGRGDLLASIRGYKTQRAHWPTPTRADSSGHGRVTPDKATTTHHTGKSLVDAAAGGQLNPTWVEWLMGFPSGWTDLEHSETPSSRKSPSGSD